MEEFIDEADHLIAAILNRKERWLTQTGSAIVPVRSGYVKGIQDAIDVITEFHGSQEKN